MSRIIFTLFSHARSRNRRNRPDCCRYPLLHFLYVRVASAMSSVKSQYTLNQCKDKITVCWGVGRICTQVQCLIFTRSHCKKGLFSARIQANMHTLTTAKFGSQCTKTLDNVKREVYFRTWIVPYPLDKVIRPLNNWGLDGIGLGPKPRLKSSVTSLSAWGLERDCSAVSGQRHCHGNFAIFWSKPLKYLTKSLFFNMKLLIQHWEENTKVFLSEEQTIVIF